MPISRIKKEDEISLYYDRFDKLKKRNQLAKIKLWLETEIDSYKNSKKRIN